MPYPPLWLFLVALLFTAVVPSTAAFQWHRHGLGRTVHVFNRNCTHADQLAHPSHASDLFLLTALGTIAQLDAATASIRWRLPPPLSPVPLHPVSALALQPPHPRLLLVLLSDHVVRAVDPARARAVWHVHACHLGVSHSQHVRIASCDGAVRAVDPASGILSDRLSVREAASFTALPDLSSATPDLRWPLADSRVLVSASDGALRLVDPFAELWRREDGIAHVAAGAIFSLHGAPIVVILSQLGAVYALQNDQYILWKVPVGRQCILLNDLSHHVVIVCTNHQPKHTILYAIRVSDGTVTFTKSIPDFRAVRASVDSCCGDQICVVAVDNSGRERWLSECDPSAYTHIQGTERGWLLYAKNARQVRGVRGGATIWNVAMPKASTVSAVVTTRPPHATASKIRPPPVRVTGFRQLLRKYVNENVILVLSQNEARAEVHALVIDSNTGTTYSAVSHRNANAPIAGVKGDNWFVYTFWNTVMLQQEIHIIDMYHRTRNGSWVGETLRAAVRALFGTEIMNAFGIPDPDYDLPCTPSIANSSRSLQCSTGTNDPTAAFSTAKPVLLRSSSLLTQRVVALDVTETTSGITESAVIMTLENGQVSVVSKFKLDARRPDTASAQHQSEFLLPYKPVLSLESSSRQSIYIADGSYVPDIKQVAVAPYLERESTTLIAVLGMDVVFSFVQPVGNFDSLPDDFLYSAVVAMIVFLAGAVFYSHKLRVRTNLSRSWQK